MFYVFNCHPCHCVWKSFSPCSKTFDFGHFFLCWLEMTHRTSRRTSSRRCSAGRLSPAREVARSTSLTLDVSREQSWQFSRSSLKPSFLALQSPGKSPCISSHPRTASGRPRRPRCVEQEEVLCCSKIFLSHNSLTLDDSREQSWPRGTTSPRWICGPRRSLNSLQCRRGRRDRTGLVARELK